MVLRRGHVIVIATSVLLCLLIPSPSFPESARPSPRAFGHRSGDFVCGTYEGRVWDELRQQKMHLDRLASHSFAPVAARTMQMGNLVVIEDDGTLIAEPHTNACDLDGMRLHFAPNANGGYDVSASSMTFSNDLGATLQTGDDTNHEVNFTSGFTFSFFGTTWNGLWIRSNGNVTFGGIGNPILYDPNDFVLELPMIAALFADLNPLAGGTVSYRQAADRFVVTWNRIPEFDNNNSNTVQLTLFANGAFDIVLNNVDIRTPINGQPMVVGFNSGRPSGSYQAADLSKLPILGSSAGAMYEAFENITYRDVNIALTARRFYEVQPDSFDQLVLITNFQLLGAPFGAFHAGISNTTKGIRVTDFSIADLFGSSGRLQSFLHMNYVNAWPNLPADLYLRVMGQEAGHRWLARVHFLRDDSDSDLLVGRQLAHWSYYLDSEASVMEGNDWRDNGNGTFTSVRTDNNFSMLDHYLMGLRAPEEVPPFMLIDIPGISLGQRSRGPQTNAITSGPKHMVRIEDIIAVEGERLPARNQSPKVFRQGYILLARKGELPSAQNIAKAESFRAAWPEWFSNRTDGRGVIQVHVGAELPVAAIQGHVTDVFNGSVVRNLEARLIEKDFIQPVVEGGYYLFDVSAESASSGEFPATLVFRAHPYLPDTAQVNLVLGSTLERNFSLSPLPKSALRGTVSNALGKPVRARLTLHAGSDLVDGTVLVDSSDAQGRFAFEDIYVSHPPTVSYDRLVVEPELPYGAQTLTNVAVDLAAQNLNIIVESVTAVDSRPAINELPGEFQLSASYPNPFRVERDTRTKIRFQLPPGDQADRVTLRIYDVLGRQVQSLFDEAYRPGYHTASWSGVDRLGNQAQSGIYFCQLEAGALRQVRKLLVVK